MSIEIQKVVLGWHETNVSGSPEGTNPVKWRQRVAEGLGVRPDTFNRWCRGQLEMNDEKVQALLNAFGLVGSDIDGRLQDQAKWELMLAAGIPADPDLYSPDWDKRRMRLAFAPDLRKLLPPGCIHSSPAAAAEPNAANPPTTPTMLELNPVQPGKFFEELVIRLVQFGKNTPLKSPWGDRFVQLLVEHCPAELDPADYRTEDVLRFIAATQGADLKGVFLALRRASYADADYRKRRVLSDVPRDWFLQLTCLTAVRFLRLDAVRLRRPIGAAHEVVVAELGTSSPLVAAAALSQMLGLRLAWREPGSGAPLIDLTRHLDGSSDRVNALLCALYDDQLEEAGFVRRQDPEQLSEGELTRLRRWMYEHQADKELKGVFVKLSSQLPLEVQTQLLDDLQSRLSAPVVKGTEHHAADLGLFQMAVADLADYLEENWQIAKEVASRDANRPVAQPVAPAPQAAPVVAEFDFFLCHASADKATFIQPLASALKAAGHNVWLDADVLVVGDSLVQNLGKGLRRSRFGVVCFSRAFFEEGRWAKEEMQALLSEQISRGTKRVLPVLLDVELEVVKEQVPLLSDKLFLRYGPGGASQLADGLSRALSVST